AAAQMAQENFDGTTYFPKGAAPAYDKEPGATGAFTHAVAMEVPRFRALAPPLALSFSSKNTQNGQVGIGWSLSGFSTLGRPAPPATPPPIASSSTASRWSPLPDSAAPTRPSASRLRASRSPATPGPSPTSPGRAVSSRASSAAHAAPSAGA